MQCKKMDNSIIVILGVIFVFIFILFILNNVNENFEDSRLKNIEHAIHYPQYIPSMYRNTFYYKTY